MEGGTKNLGCILGIPGLLFAYREVPQASTGFSPFELLFGRHVRSPLNVLKNSWVGEKEHWEGEQNVLEYVVKMRERLANLTECVSENLEKAQNKQKAYYDKKARTRSFAPGDRVHFLLPSSTRKLEAAWQGPYTVIEKVGPVDYKLSMPKRRGKTNVFHVNMLLAWKEDGSTQLLYLAQEYYSLGNHHNEEDTGLNEKQNGSMEDVNVTGELSDNERKRLLLLLNEFSDVFSHQHGRTALAEHKNFLKTERPVRQRVYRIPHSYREQVKEELREMERMGVIRPSTSEWPSPLLVVPKKDGSLDFRKQNEVSELDAYPMPRVDEILDRFGQAN